MSKGDRLMVLLSAADSRYAVRALLFCDLDAVEVVRRDRRVPNTIPFDGLKIDKPVVPKLGVTGLSLRAKSNRRIR
jgi:hypothetical protein